MYLNRQNKNKKETKLLNSVGRKSKKNISKSIDEREKERTVERVEIFHIFFSLRRLCARQFESIPVNFSRFTYLFSGGTIADTNQQIHASHPASFHSRGLWESLGRQDATKQSSRGRTKKKCLACLRNRDRARPKFTLRQCTRARARARAPVSCPHPKLLSFRSSFSLLPPSFLLSFLSFQSFLPLLFRCVLLH